jgi:hypothetical protein
MAVKSKQEGEKLILEIDNGDLTKLDDALQKWNFKDYQSLLRFSVSMLILNEDRSFSIKRNGEQKSVVPASDLLKEGEKK